MTPTFYVVGCLGRVGTATDDLLFDVREKLEPLVAAVAAKIGG